MTLKMDQSCREDPLYAPMSDADLRAQEAYEKAEDARREFAFMAERFGREASALAGKFGLATDNASDLGVVFWENLTDAFDLPTPDQAADRARNE